MEEEGEGLGGSGPGRVWPVSAMPPLREDGVRSSQPLWEQCHAPSFSLFNLCLELCFAADASADLPPPPLFPLPLENEEPGWRS